MDSPASNLPISYATVSIGLAIFLVMRKPNVSKVPSMSVDRANLCIAQSLATNSIVYRNLRNAVA